VLFFSEAPSSMCDGVYSVWMAVGDSLERKRKLAVLLGEAEDPYADRDRVRCRLAGFEHPGSVLGEGEEEDAA
jgi:hypothetical protein